MGSDQEKRGGKAEKEGMRKGRPRDLVLSKDLQKKKITVLARRIAQVKCRSTSFKRPLNRRVRPQQSYDRDAVTIPSRSISWHVLKPSSIRLYIHKHLSRQFPSVHLPFPCFSTRFFFTYNILCRIQRPASRLRLSHQNTHFSQNLAIDERSVRYQLLCSNVAFV